MAWWRWTWVLFLVFASLVIAFGVGIVIAIANMLAIANIPREIQKSRWQGIYFLLC